MRLRREPPRHDRQLVIRSDLLSAIHLQDDLVGEPVRDEVHDDGKTEGRHEALRAAKQLAERKQKAAEEAEEQDGFQRIVHMRLDVLVVGSVSKSSLYRTRYNGSMQRVGLAVMSALAAGWLTVSAQVPQP